MVHRDIKPENLLMGLGAKSNTVYLVDFGISNLFIEANGKHIPPSKECSLIGTVRYASYNSHMGLELSRRDDMLALGYFIYYVLSGRLPWQDDVNPFSSRCRLVASKKAEFERSFQVKLGPPEFATYMQHCTNLSYEARPDYTMLKELIKEVAARERIDLNDGCLIRMQVIACKNNSTSYIQMITQ